MNRAGIDFMQNLIYNRILENGLDATIIWADRCLKDIKLQNRHRSAFMAGCIRAFHEFLDRHKVHA